MTMNMKRFLSSLVLAALAMTGFNASAGNISADVARKMANDYIRQQASKGSFKAHAASDIRLVHSEASSKANGANVYYVFNIKGGGFVIIAGEDRATQVLGYSDTGRLDCDNLPYGLQGLLDSYKLEIEFLQSYTKDDLIPAPKTFTATAGVEPLIKTTWGQEMPYYLQCPKESGEYCVVGCVATAMAQVMRYWKYPTSSNAISSYYCQDLGTVGALPATTFDYSLMIESYSHWDWNTSQLIQDSYTDAQAQEVAKLGRYCGQSVQMSYSPNGSGAYSYAQTSAMKNFGYTGCRRVSRGSGWSGYSTDQWEAMIKTELDAGRPILYSANDTGGAGGHAFICDGYNNEGLFHFNMGWYGTCDGWYTSTALNMTHREGDYLKFNSGHEMTIGIIPYEGYVIPGDEVLRGDVNKDGAVNVKDVTALIDILMNGLDAPDEAKCDDSTENVSIKDLTALINYLMNGAW